MPGVMIIEIEDRDTAVDQMLQDPVGYRRHAFAEARRDVVSQLEPCPSDPPEQMLDLPSQRRAEDS